ncbi:MAG: hypothetical protein J2P23_08170, partial [Microlunatus sp.]|nr:hypothetical protein [Microlunatus sp.]
VVTDAPAGARALRDVLRDRAFRSIEAWEHGATNPYPPAWREVAMAAEWELKLTVQDLEQLQSEIKAILDRYTSREQSPDDAVRSKVLAWAFPVGPPPKQPPPSPEKRRGNYLRSSRSRSAGDQP